MEHQQSYNKKNDSRRISKMVIKITYVVKDIPTQGKSNSLHWVNISKRENQNLATTSNKLSTKK